MNADAHVGADKCPHNEATPHEVVAEGKIGPLTIIKDRLYCFLSEIPSPALTFKERRVQLKHQQTTLTLVIVAKRPVFARRKSSSRREELLRVEVKLKEEARCPDYCSDSRGLPINSRESFHYSSETPAYRSLFFECVRASVREAEI